MAPRTLTELGSVGAGWLEIGANFLLYCVCGFSLRTLKIGGGRGGWFNKKEICKWEGGCSRNIPSNPNEVGAFGHVEAIAM